MARILVDAWSSWCSECNGNALVEDAAKKRHDSGGSLLYPGRGCGAVWDQLPLNMARGDSKFSAGALVRMGLSGRYDLLETR
jgi:hypothetical protein